MIPKGFPVLHMVMACRCMPAQAFLKCVGSSQLQANSCR